MAEFSSRHLLGIRGLNRSDIDAILETAREFKEIGRASCRERV